MGLIIVFIDFMQSMWWKKSHENEAIEDPINNEEFVKSLINYLLKR